MNNYLISFDLKAVGRNYKPIYDYMATYGDSIKPLQTVYLVRSSKTAGQIRDDLQKLVDGNDLVLVVGITTNSWATLRLPKTTEWLHSH